MTRCMGCGNLADRYWIGDSDRGICTPCTLTLGAGEITRPISSRTVRRCYYCDNPVYHDMDLCVLCRSDLFDVMASSWGLAILDENPFVLELLKPQLRFQSSMQVSIPWGEYTTWIYSTEHTGWHTIKFHGLVKEFEESP